MKAWCTNCQSTLVDGYCPNADCPMLKPSNQSPTDKAVEAESPFRLEDFDPSLDLSPKSLTPLLDSMAAYYANDGEFGRTKEQVEKAIMALIKSSNLALLDRVEEEVIGEDSVWDTSTPLRKLAVAVTYDRPGVVEHQNQLRDKQRQTLTSIRKEYE